MQHRFIASLHLHLTRAIRNLALEQCRASASATPRAPALMGSLPHSCVWCRACSSLISGHQAFPHSSWGGASSTLRQPCRRLPRSVELLQCRAESSSPGPGHSDPTKRTDDNGASGQQPRPLSPAGLAPAAAQEVQQDSSVDVNSLGGYGPDHAPFTPAAGLSQAACTVRHDPPT